MGDIVKTTVFEGVRATITSRDFGEVFHERHDNVLAKIRKLLETQPSLHLLRFQEMSETTIIGNGATRKDPAFSMDRVGANILASRFTSPKATDYIIALMERFEELDRQLSTADPIEAMLEAALETRRRQLALERSHQDLDRRVSALEPADGWMSLRGFMRVNGMEVPSRLKLAEIGRKVAALSRKSGKEPEKIPDERDGHVNAYPREVLEQFFSLREPANA